MNRLERFVQAQDGVYETVCAELSAGRKQTHWMWFIFPQLSALGRSGTARHFGLEGSEDAAAYWQHPVLGPRLKRCCELLLGVRGKTAHEIFGSPDDIKLRSSMTLFEAAVPDEPSFAQVLERCCAGVRDEATLRLIGARGR